MKRPLQQVSQETLSRLGEDGLSVTCWIRPHHAYGWMKNVLALNEGSGVITVATWQSFSVIPDRRKREEIDDSFEHVEHALDAQCLTPVLNMLATSALPWRPSQSPSGFLGASHFGLRVHWGGIETERRWHGHLEDIDDVTRSIWQFVDGLIAAPTDSLQK